jgi:hypothetical protein
VTGEVADWLGAVRPGRRRPGEWRHLSLRFEGLVLSCGGERSALVDEHVRYGHLTLEVGAELQTARDRGERGPRPRKRRPLGELTGCRDRLDGRVADALLVRVRQAAEVLVLDADRL